MSNFKEMDLLKDLISMDEIRVGEYDDFNFRYEEVKKNVKQEKELYDSQQIPTKVTVKPKVSKRTIEDKTDSRDGITPIELGKDIVPNMSVGIFWDLENVNISNRWPSIPYGMLINKMLIFGSSFGKIKRFTSYCDVTKGRGIHQEKKESLQKSGVELVFVSNSVPEATDHAILVDMCLFAGEYKPQETVIILISGDGDFSIVLNHLRRMGYVTVVVVNSGMKVKNTLKASASYFVTTTQIVRRHPQSNPRNRQSAYWNSPVGKLRFDPNSENQNIYMSNQEIPEMSSSNRRRRLLALGLSKKSITSETKSSQLSTNQNKVKEEWNEQESNRKDDFIINQSY